jgi:hypothetical protein
MNNRKLTDYESIRFNIFIDRIGITNKSIYKAILEDYIESGLSINMFCNR